MNDQFSLFDPPRVPGTIIEPERYILRDYQRKAVDAIKWSMQKGLPGNDLLVLPTGAGKSLILSSLADELGSKGLILQPSKELLEQNFSKLSQYVPQNKIGIFSASMGRKDISFITFATIGSIYQYPQLFRDIEWAIVDECHLINPKKESGMYSAFFADVNQIRRSSDPPLAPVKVIGLTATPYRLMPCYQRIGHELICQVGIKMINRMPPVKSGKTEFRWDRLMYNINNKELVDQGYLCPLRYESIDFVKQQDIPLNKTKSDFDLTAYEEKVKGKDGLIVEKIREMMDKHKSILFFNPSIAQAKRLHEITSDIQRASEFVTGKTPAKEREAMIRGFKNGSIPIMFNVGVLTTGFDHPGLSCIMLNRPTRSIGLYYQMLGRGVRTFPGKEFCQVIDFTNTVEQIGPVESLELLKIIDPDEEPFNGRPVTAKWNLRTSTGLWHNKILYSWAIDLPASHKPEPRDDFDTIFGEPDPFDFRSNDLEF